MRVLAVAAPSDATQLATSGWSDIPDMNGQIVLSASSDLAITFSAEAYVTDVANLFIRALVDGQPATPGDAVLAVEDFTGARSFTFIRPNLVAGGHDVRLQWILSGPGEGRVNDRTLNVVAVQNAGSYRAGALMLAAPTGVAQSTTSTTWIDVPDLTGSITTPDGGDLTMTFSGEIAATAGKRVFLRALVDGQPTRPPMCACSAVAGMVPVPTASSRPIWIQAATPSSSSGSRIRVVRPALATELYRVFLRQAKSGSLVALTAFKLIDQSGNLRPQRWLAVCCGDHCGRPYVCDFKQIAARLGAVAERRTRAQLPIHAV